MTRWIPATPADAERMASATAPVVWVADAVNGFARPLGAGETEADAVADFEAAGEPTTRSEVFGG